MKIGNIPVLCEFFSVIPKELPGLPPQREIDFVINLIPSPQPISKVHMRWLQQSSKN